MVETVVRSAEHRTRLWMGGLMAGMTAGLLFLDQHLAPWYPCMLVYLLAAGLMACVEMHWLLAGGQRPPLWLCLFGVFSVLLANWPAHLAWWGKGQGWLAWRDIQSVVAFLLILGLLFEMATFQAPGGSVQRIALLMWMITYLGVLPSFLAQMRWRNEPTGAGLAALALTIFVAKAGDIGAYFTGRLLGRHRMTPVLSPKKTWEGFAGGMAASALTSVLLNRFLPPPLLGPVWKAAGFGLTVGLAGVLGDLAESLIKRDCGKKDASQVVPGFGGILDVIDSVLFAAPVAYGWFRAFP
jgi:phosphatidate cytidylyltransferase